MICFVLVPGKLTCFVSVSKVEFICFLWEVEQNECLILEDEKRYVFLQEDTKCDPYVDSDIPTAVIQYFVRG